MEEELTGIEITKHIKPWVFNLGMVFNIATLGVGALGIALDLIRDKKFTTDYMDKMVCAVSFIIANKINYYTIIYKYINLIYKCLIKY